MKSFCVSFFLMGLLFLVPEKSYSANQTYYAVVLGSTDKAAEANALAKKASAILKDPIAPDTLKKALAAPLYLGIVLQVVGEGSQYQVLNFLRETESEAKTILAKTQKQFPQAKIKTFELDPLQLASDYQMTYMMNVLILASEKNYAVAVKKAQSLSKQFGMPYSNRELTWTAGRGLHWPGTSSDEDPYAGSYLARRDNYLSATQDGSFLSVEMSDYYPGFTPGLYLVVGGIYSLKDAELAAQLEKMKKVVPDAYAKASAIYLGCLH